MDRSCKWSKVSQLCVSSRLVWQDHIIFFWLISPSSFELWTRNASVNFAATVLTRKGKDYSDNKSYKLESRSVVRIAKSHSNDYSNDCRQNKHNRSQMTIPTTSSEVLGRFWESIRKYSILLVIFAGEREDSIPKSKNQLLWTNFARNGWHFFTLFKSFTMHYESFFAVLSNLLTGNRVRINSISTRGSKRIGIAFSRVFVKWPNTTNAD
jgi:hypothetical protein